MIIMIIKLCYQLHAMIQSLNKAPDRLLPGLILLNAGFGMGGQRYENTLEK